MESESASQTCAVLPAHDTWTPELALTYFSIITVAITVLAIDRSSNPHRATALQTTQPGKQVSMYDV